MKSIITAILATTLTVCIVNFFDKSQKDIETITNVVTIHDTIYFPKTEIVRDTVIKIKRVYIEKEPFKSNIPSTILFKKE